ncbi:ATP-binding protein [Clostridium estertheticum]|uniref:AAA family ATPase n=1 Tax=Clostridium estertheticum TaxID=238834 RepID=UPI0013E98F87|nr:ATP-binding protein [Clostridium estertheticum]MBZ9689340.1 ATP-binding protein [Clostridium estertheticum]
MEYVNKILINNGGEAEIANYKEQIIKEYHDNPLIECLPNIISSEEAIDKLAVYPYFSEEERNLESHIRYHLIQRLFQYFQPLNWELDLESRVSRVIRQGYIARNPFIAEYAESFGRGHKMILNANMEMTNNKSFRTTSSGFTIIGISGIGKSTAIKLILSMYPQIIVHNEYKGFKFSMYQVAWLKLDCGHEGSIKGLCIDFFLKIDGLLGTNYHKKYGSGRQAVNVLMPIMGQIAKNIGLGVLVIDEIQHLSLAKSGGADKMLNFFVTLVNIGIPIILIGTNKAMSILQSQFRQARRGSGQGDFLVDRLKNDENWDLIIEGMADYQWTRKPIIISREIKDTLYEFSQGITDIAIKLFAMAQIRAISSGKEEITANIIRSVAKENLQLVRPMIEALKSGSIKAIAQYEDLYSVNIDNFLGQESSKISLNNKIRELQNNKKLNENLNKDNIKEQAILKLIDLDVESIKAKKYVEESILNKGRNIEIKELVKESYKLSLEMDIVKKETRTSKRKQDIDNVNDLRFIVAEGKRKGITAYEALNENRYIKHFDKETFKVG